MSVQAMTRVMASSEAAGIARLVLLVMANRAGADSDLAFPSVDLIAHECRISRRAVQNNLAKLVASGDLRFEGEHPKYRTKIYAVMPERGVQDMHGASSEPEAAPNTNKAVVSPTEIRTADTRSLGQRANALAEMYWRVQPLCVFPAIAGVARTALKAGREDEDVGAALVRLAEEGRSVTVESLRIEMDGLAPYGKRDPVKRVLQRIQRRRDDEGRGLDGGGTAAGILPGA